MFRGPPPPYEQAIGFSYVSNTKFLPINC